MTEIVNGTLRMTSDRLLIKPLEWNGEEVHGAGSKIVAIRHGNPVRGRVIAVGPGHNPICKRTNLGDGRRRIEYSKRFRPTEVRPGDVVEFGALNRDIFDGKSYPFTEVIYNGELHLICQERDVCIVRDDLRAQERPKSRYIAPSIHATNVDWAYERRMEEALDGRA